MFFSFLENTSKERPKYNFYGVRIENEPKTRWEEKLNQLTFSEIRETGLSKEKLEDVLNYLYERDVIR